MRSEVAALDAEVVGVSLDSAEKHEAFAQAYNLEFPLVSDRDGVIAGKFGVARLGGWLPTKRVTFVIDKNGVVRRVIHSEFGITKHIEEALDELRGLQQT